MLPIYTAYPFMQSLASWLFGVSFTRSSEAGFHIYGDAAFMFELALYQLPFSLALGVLIAVKGRLSADNLPRAFGQGLWLSVVSGLAAGGVMYGIRSAPYRFLGFFDYFIQSVAAYVCCYFIFGLSLLLGGLVTVGAAMLVPSRNRDEGENV